MAGFSSFKSNRRPLAPSRLACSLDLSKGGSPCPPSHPRFPKRPTALTFNRPVAPAPNLDRDNELLTYYFDSTWTTKDIAEHFNFPLSPPPSAPAPTSPLSSTSSLPLANASPVTSPAKASPAPSTSFFALAASATTTRPAARHLPPSSPFARGRVTAKTAAKNASMHPNVHALPICPRPATWIADPTPTTPIAQPIPRSRRPNTVLRSSRRHLTVRPTIRSPKPPTHSRPSTDSTTPSPRASPIARYSGRPLRPRRLRRRRFTFATLTRRAPTRACNDCWA